MELFVCDNAIALRGTFERVAIEGFQNETERSGLCRSLSLQPNGQPLTND